VICLDRRQSKFRTPYLFPFHLFPRRTHPSTFRLSIKGASQPQSRVFRRCSHHYWSACWMPLASANSTLSLPPNMGPRPTAVCVLQPPQTTFPHPLVSLLQPPKTTFPVRSFRTLVCHLLRQNAVFPRACRSVPHCSASRLLSVQ
jgi:hypothetical protein